MRRAEKMPYFDLVCMKAPALGLQDLLGFKKIFSTEEILIFQSSNPDAEKCLVRSKEQGVLRSAIKRNNVAGIMISDNELLRMVIEEARENDKPIFLATHDFTCTDSGSRIRNLHRAETLLRFAMRSKAKARLVSLAEDNACLLSSMQMLEIAKFLSGSEEYAKKMVSGW